MSDSTRQPGFLLQLLGLVGNGSANIAVRQAAAVFYKNTIKTAWDESKEPEERKNIDISQQDRNTIKTNLVELMCTVPPQIQAQISEAISITAEVDYPEKWDGLLPNLVGKFDSPDTNVVNGVLMTADSIFKRFRHVQRSDELYRVIIYTLKHIQEPLLKLLVHTGNQADALANDPAQLAPKMETLRLVASILYSLVYQDLPEYYEDNMAHVMGVLKKFLEYKNPVLIDDSEEDEPGPIDKLQSAIIDILKLFVERDEEPFQPFLPDFTTIVWNLLMSKTKYPKHDQVVVTSMKFLDIMVGRQMYNNLFKETSTLQQIVANIVIPNMTIRESDEENFEDNPQEFIMTELEGSDNESRRRGSRDLLGAMCRQFEKQTTSICNEHMTKMLAEFAADTSKWVSKDTAVSTHYKIAYETKASYAKNFSLFFSVFFLDFPHARNFDSKTELSRSFRIECECKSHGFLQQSHLARASRSGSIESPYGQGSILEFCVHFPEPIYSTTAERVVATLDLPPRQRIRCRSQSCSQLD